MQLLLATSNRGKIIEMREALGGLGLDIRSPDDFGMTEAPQEVGDTFEKNALLKARFYAERVKMPTLADDSGIVVHALGKQLGVQTRRWGAGASASDKDWIDYFLRYMRDQKNRRARFVCCLAFIDAAAQEHVFQGTCDGIITDHLEASYLPGLPISACFKPDDFDIVYSAMSTEQKNNVSHRGKALGALRSYLATTIP